jgi:adenosylcobinamide-phosphate synthase
MWFGALIDYCDTRLNRPYSDRRRNGIVTLVLLVLAALVPSLIVIAITRNLPFGWVLEALLATPFLAQKELGRAVNAVADALGTSLAAARKAVAEIVGRDTADLDEAGISRAAVETLAESASDGVVAPLFWLVLFGLPGIVVYKAVNTADSMIGHRTDRYRDFGWASARTDDWLNWLPARLTAVLITAACFFVPAMSPGAAWATARRDAKKHDSPNAGWPEAAMAGALGLTLGGPRAYAGEVVDLPAFGAGRSDLTRNDIRRALWLYRVLLNVTLAVAVAVALLVYAA